jgi:hypothetical protein
VHELEYSIPAAVSQALQPLPYVFGTSQMFAFELLKVTMFVAELAVTHPRVTGLMQGQLVFPPHPALVYICACVAATHAPLLHVQLTELVQDD